MNRIVFPWPLYPLAGDVESTEGTQTVTVVGLQTVPLDTAILTGGEVIEFDPNIGHWRPYLRATIQVNGMYASDDNIISVNISPLIQVNGV